MSELLQIIRSVVQQELAHHRTSLLGVVTATTPHSAEDDVNNYEATVRLKHEALELRQVPIAVSHMGIAAPPRVGDLVLVQFIDGDLNQPVITGRFYHEGDRAPLYRDGEILFEQRVAADNTLNHLRFTYDGTIYLQRAVTNPTDNSEALTSCKIDGATGELEMIVANGTTIRATSDTVTIEGTVQINGDLTVSDGDLTVSNGAQSTTISGNEITGA